MKQSRIFLILFLAISTLTFAQRNYNDYNAIGVFGGISNSTIQTDDLQVTPGNSFMLGFHMRGNFYNNFELMYGLSFYNSKFSILGAPSAQGFASQDIRYGIQAVQVSVLGGYKLFDHHLSIEAGPVLNINSTMNLEDTAFEEYIIEGYDTLQAKDLEPISRINFHLAAGITAGFDHFRVFAQYQYGVTNMLKKLQEVSSEANTFQGNMSLLAFGVAVYF